jgi:hypothetical protein
VRFEIARATGPFELCHCTRCRKASGSAFAAMVGVDVADYRLLQGAELIARYEAPIRERPPPYGVAFCGLAARRFGSARRRRWFEIGGLLTATRAAADAHLRGHQAPWFEPGDAASDEAADRRVAAPQSASHDGES